VRNADSYQEQTHDDVHVLHQGVTETRMQRSIVGSSRARERTVFLFTLIVLLSTSGCARFPGAATPQLRWGLYLTHASNAVLLYGDVGDEVRLLNPAGEAVANAVLHSPDQGPCKATYVLPLSAVDVHNFGMGRWPAGYRVQQTVTGHWTDVVLLCSIMCWTWRCTSPWGDRKE
jgi:hypothetical protein